MILSYNGHTPINIKSGKVSVLATNNPVVFKEILWGINDFSDNLKLYDDSYKNLEIAKLINFDTEILLNHKLFEKYNKNLISTVITNMTEDNQGMVNKNIQNLFSSLQESLFMTDLPIEVSYDGNLKRMLNYCHMHFSPESGMNPYGIIINDLKLHLECNLKSILCFSNLANWLSKEEFSDLLSVVSSVKLPLLLVEFTELKKKDFYRDVEGLFIDQDFVDWKI